MLFQFESFLTTENIYLFTGLGVLPFWFMMVFIPRSSVTLIFVNSIMLPLILAVGYGYLLYQAVLLEESFIDIIKLYMSLDNLYTVFSTEIFLLLFWLHFLALNLFLGSWVTREGVRYNIPKLLIAFPIIMIYFTGPIGLVFYWFIRIFYAKKFWFND